MQTLKTETITKKLVLGYLRFVAKRFNLSLSEVLQLTKKPSKTATKFVMNCPTHSFSDLPPIETLSMNGVLIHKETKFVIQQDKWRFVVTGKVDHLPTNEEQFKNTQLQLLPLSVHDIQRCKELNLEYHLPLTLSDMKQESTEKDIETRMDEIYHRITHGDHESESESEDE